MAFMQTRQKDCHPLLPLKIGRPFREFCSKLLNPFVSSARCGKIFHLLPEFCERQSINQKPNAFKWRSFPLISGAGPPRLLAFGPKPCASYASRQLAALKSEPSEALCLETGDLAGHCDCFKVAHVRTQ